jgi:predicted extracellular nuclease
VIWVAQPALDVVSPVLSGVVGPLNGNAPANRVALSATISGLYIPPMGTIWLRWRDVDLAPGADDGLAIDDVAITPVGAALSDAPPAVVAVHPADGTRGVATDRTLTVTFSEAVDAAAGAFLLSCRNLGDQPFALSGGPVTFTLDPVADLPADATCTLTIVGPLIADRDSDDPPDTVPGNVRATFATRAAACADPFTPIAAIQGAGESSPIAGEVTTQGVVVGDFESSAQGNGRLGGFFLQDAAGDGNPATSEGLFVANGSADSVALGDLVRVTGAVAEVEEQTQIVAPSALHICGAGSVAPTELTLPLSPGRELEQLEGMLVRLPQTVSVTDHSSLARTGEVVLSSGGRLPVPTDVALPGTAAAAVAEQNARNRLILDDDLQREYAEPILFGRGGAALSSANPLRAGDTVQGLVGVLMQTTNGVAGSEPAYRVRPLVGEAVLFQPANPRQPAPARSGRLRVASLNTGGYFNTVDGEPGVGQGCSKGVAGPPTPCLGADTLEEHARQLAKLVAALQGADADILLLQGVENDGYGPESALRALVDGLNGPSAAGTWALLDVDARTGQVDALGSDVTRVAVIYRPARVAPVGTTTVLSTPAFLTGGDSLPRNRAVLLQGFAETLTGARFELVGVDLAGRSFPCDAPNAADGQGPCADVRTMGASLLATWLQGNPAASADPDRLVMGSLNAFRQEDALRTLTGAGLLLLAPTAGSADTASVAGTWGALDHALATPALAPQVAAVQVWAINADEPAALDYNTENRSPTALATLYAPDPWRSAPRNMVLVDLNLAHGAPEADAGGPYALVEGSAVTLAGAGSDPEGKAVALAWDLDGDGLFEVAGATATLAAPDGPLTRTVQLRVTDAGGLASVATAVVQVANAPPQLGPLAAPDALPIQAPLSLSVAFSDAGRLDTQRALWAWGDGRTAAGQVAGVGVGSVAGTVAWSQAGLYRLSLTLTDKDGAQAVASHEVAVYDPAGQAQADGTLALPPGVWLPGPGVSGLLELRLSAAYGSAGGGAAVARPVGAAEVRFAAAALQVESTALRWLVVRDGVAMLEGAAQVNGLAGHRLRVTLRMADAAPPGSAVEAPPGSTASPVATAAPSARVQLWSPQGALLLDSGIGAPGGSGLPAGMRPLARGSLWVGVGPPPALRAAGFLPLVVR